MCMPLTHMRAANMTQTVTLTAEKLTANAVLPSDVRMCINMTVLTRDDDCLDEWVLRSKFGGGKCTAGSRGTGVVADAPAFCMMYARPVPSGSRVPFPHKPVS